jgi:SAM-dependent methyltransferase
MSFASGVLLALCLAGGSRLQELAITRADWSAMDGRLRIEGHGRAGEPLTIRNAGDRQLLSSGFVRGVKWGRNITGPMPVPCRVRVEQPGGGFAERDVARRPPTCGAVAVERPTTTGSGKLADMSTPLLSVEEVWRRYDADEVRLSAPLSERMLDLADLGPGSRVLDLATGRGEPALRAAHRVGPSGRVVGVDSSPEMLRLARARADVEGLANLELVTTPAEQLERVVGPFDATLARWGLMYLQQPVAALSAARRVMKLGAPLVAAVWAEPERVSYFTVPRRALQPHHAVPPQDPDAPGTFFYADLDRLTRDLRLAGFALEHTEDFEVDVMQARTDAELIAWVRAFGLARLVNALPEATQRAWEQDLVMAAQPFRRGGSIFLGGTTRLVVARASGEV